MNLEEYQTMFSVEDRHWWYVALRGMLNEFWLRYVREKRPRVLDVGCGTGAVLDALSPLSEPTGVDLSPEAVRFSRKRSQDRSGVASALALPFAAGSFDVALSFDVLCNKSIPQWYAPLHEIHRILKPGGILLLNLPAYQWLYSSHDVAVHTARRFTRRQVLAGLRACSFQSLRATYWNTLLFPPIVVVRLWRKMRPPAGSDLAGACGGFSNRFFGCVLALERRLARAVPLPFGLSIFAAARKM